MSRNTTTSRQSYIRAVPKSGKRYEQVLSGELCVVHNHVRPEGFPDIFIGWQGFRAWVDVPTPEQHDIEPCECGWAPELEVGHFKVVPGSFRELA